MYKGTLPLIVLILRVKFAYPDKGEVGWGYRLFYFNIVKLNKVARQVSFLCE